MILADFSNADPNVWDRIFRILQFTDCFGADHVAVGDNENTLDLETMLQFFNDRKQGFHIRGVSRSHLTAYGLPLIVDDSSNDHLFEIRAMILTKPSLTDRITTASFEVNRGGIKEHEIQLRKKIPAMSENKFFNQVLVAAR